MGIAAIIKNFLLLLFIGAIFTSAIQLIVVRHQSRLAFAELQTLQQQRDALNIEWRQLQLEHSTWTQPARIEAIARDRLQMVVPTPQEIVVIKP